MAQVNSTPGQNQALGTVAVASAVSEVTGTPDAKVVAAAKAVKYAQSEPGRKSDVAEGKRS